MKKYLIPEIEFLLSSEIDVLTASYDKTDFVLDDDNFADDIFFNIT